MSQKIAIVMPLAKQQGGAEMMLIRLLEANACGPKIEYVVAFFEDGPMVAQIAALGYATTVFSAGHLRQTNRYLGTVWALRAWLRREGVSAVLSWMEKAHLYASPAAYLAGIPSAYFLHSIPGDHWMNKLAPRLPTSVVLCCGESVRQAQETMRPQIPTRRAYIAVDLERFRPDRLPSPSEAKTKVGLDPDKTIVGIVARLQRWKGVHIFLEAAALVAKSHKEVSFVVVGSPHWGEPDYPAELEAQAKRDGLENQVFFAGHQTDIPLWMQAMDIIVHASDNEPTGTVILEGMAMGKPVIASRTAGPMEFVLEDECGLLSPPGDASALAEAIQLLLENPDEREVLSMGAKQRASQFGTDRLARDVASHMLEICRA